MEAAIAQFPLVKYATSAVRDMLINILKTGPIPKHIALIMDGNRRYARRRKWETSEGHNAGFETLSSILEFCYKAGIETVTVFAFSIENFKRSKREVESLMEIAKSRLVQICENGDLAQKYGMKIKILGNRKLIPKDVREVADRAMDITKDNNKVTLNICFPYTSSDDIAHAIQVVVDKVKGKDLRISDISADLIDEHLYTSESPPVDILIRTSGIERFSNFMVWQCNEGATVVFIKPLWPEFSFRHLYTILLRWSLSQATASYRRHITDGSQEDDGQYSDSSTLDDSEEEDAKLK